MRTGYRLDGGGVHNHDFLCLSRTELIEKQKQEYLKNELEVITPIKCRVHINVSQHSSFVSLKFDERAYFPCLSHLSLY